MVDRKRGYVGRYKECLAQQESGAALSNSSSSHMFPVCYYTQQQCVSKQYVLRKYFRDLQMVVGVYTVCVISVKEEAVLVREVKTIINPRHACAARVTVVVLCICLSVCLFVCQRLFSHYRLRGGL